MINRTVVVVGGLLFLLVAVGAVQVVAGLTGDDGETAEAAFPDVAPYIEPTATATPVLLPVSDVPGEDIPDIPRYPESVRVAYATTETDAANTVELEYQTLDPLDPVHEHVRAIVDTYGWTLAHEAFSGGERTFGLSRDGEDVQIRLRIVEGRTVISIVYSVLKQPEPAVPEVVESEPEAPPVQEPPPAEPAESQENKPDDAPGQEKQEEDESDDQDDKDEQKPDKDENENKGPGNNNGNGSGPPEDKGPDDKKDDGDEKEKDDKKEDDD